MIGFEVPKYEINGNQKGGYQWLERGLENLLIGSKKANLKPDEYQQTAKELFEMLSLHDNYWKSQEFAEYLSSLKSSPTISENQIKAVDATIEAIKELNEHKKNKNCFFYRKRNNRNERKIFHADESYA